MITYEIRPTNITELFVFKKNCDDQNGQYRDLLNEFMKIRFNQTKNTKLAIFCKNFKNIKDG